ncbi:ATP-binding protein [Acetobacter conturbans]|uniref:histidine kinase n=1 Tax=Acetobacter conturbans TaxID=1737472 RepID=A0ABX0K3X5_9PROT|nr:ATP-binding protein [Acetobacter conturbans]NHN89511.1 HAMP domain-containing protein [Acetobacter conturbans]
MTSFPPLAALRRVFPQTIFGQMVAILVTSLLLTFCFVVLLLRAVRPALPPLPVGPWPDTLAIETAIRSLRAIPVSVRQQAAEGMSAAGFHFQLNKAFPCTPQPTDHETGLVHRILMHDFPDDAHSLSVVKCASGDRISTNIIFPRDGIHVSVISNFNFHDVIHMTLPITVPFLSLLVMTAALSLWSVWRVNRPLSVLARKADTLGYDTTSPPLEEQGPREVRRVIRAFNRMQSRIRLAAEERTRMLMSISHDLRTPLTRLSMRVELGGEDAAPSVMRNDLSLMKQMLNGALAFLNGQRETEPFETVELRSLLESLCEEFSSVGKQVSYEGEQEITCFCQPVSISRAVNNLIENGLKYGKTVKVNAWSETDEAIIEVQDAGPGIPDNMRLEMLQPFARMDRARSVDGSLGLGLSIVQDIMARHHGIVSFHDATPTGLIVRLTLPANAPRSKGRRAT